MVTSGRALASYETACQALAEARTVDEVKDIHDQAVAMAAYARLAKNRKLEADAIEIRMRATRRMDQMRMAQKQTIGLAKPGRKKNGLRENPIPTLASQGLNKNLAHQARLLGAMDEAVRAQGRRGAGWRFPPRCPRNRDPAVLRGHLRDHPRAQARV